MEKTGPGYPSTHWHALDLSLRSVDLEGRFLDDLKAGRESFIRKMHDLWGPNPPKEVRANIDRALKVDLRRQAQSLALLYRTEVRTKLDVEIREAQEAALASQIASYVRMFEEKHGLPKIRSVTRSKARQQRKPSVTRELARVDALLERHPDPGLRAEANRWRKLHKSLPMTAKHLARLPLATLHDLDLYLLVAGSLDDREKAVRHLIEKGFLAAGGWLDGSLRGRREAKAQLAILAKERGQAWVYDWLQNVILPAALLLGADDARVGEPAQVRLGDQWVLDLEGRKALVAPWELADGDLASWIRRRSIQRAEEGILGGLVVLLKAEVSLSSPVEKRRTSKGESPTSAELGDLLATTAPAPEDVLLKKEAKARELARLRALAEVVAKLPENDQALLALRAEDQSYAEIAGLLGGNATALRKQHERLLTSLKLKLQNLSK